MRILKGFTLIELVITLAVIAIMSSLVLTFSSAFLQDNRIATVNNDLIGSINFTRSVAVTRGQRASICSSSNGTSCTGTAWELGWIVFTDSGVAGAIDGNDNVVKVARKVGVGVSVTSPKGFIQFKPQGSIASTCVDCFDKIPQHGIDSVLLATLNNLSIVSTAYASDEAGEDAGEDSSDSSASGSKGSSGSTASSGSSGGSGKSAKERTINCVAPDSQVKEGQSGSSGNSGSKASSGSGKSTARLKIEQYTDYAVNALEQLSPIVSAHASEDLDSSSDSDSESEHTGSSGSSGSTASSGASKKSTEKKAAVATCDDGSSSSSGSSKSKASASSSQSAAVASSNAPTGSAASASSNGSAASGNGSAAAAISNSSASDAASEGSVQKPLTGSTFLICDSSKAAENGSLISVAAAGRVSRVKVRCN